MCIQDILDKLVNSHGNRQGLSIGFLTTAWLTYIVSESDHRMVETCADKHIQTLSAYGYSKDHRPDLPQK
jgi:hypothetical protein